MPWFKIFIYTLYMEKIALYGALKKFGTALVAYLFTR